MGSWAAGQLGTSGQPSFVRLVVCTTSEGQPKKGERSAVPGGGGMNRAKRSEGRGRHAVVHDEQPAAAGIDARLEEGLSECHAVVVQQGQQLQHGADDLAAAAAPSAHRSPLGSMAATRQTFIGACRLGLHDYPLPSGRWKLSASEVIVSGGDLNLSWCIEFRPSRKQMLTTSSSRNALNGSRRPGQKSAMNTICL